MIETKIEMDGRAGDPQPVPKCKADAEAFFFCSVLACRLMGHRCAQNYVDGMAGAASRVSCRGCKAGKARERLLRGQAAPKVVNVGLAAPERRRCESCGMQVGSMRHTPTACRRATEAIQAAASPYEAQRRAEARAAAMARAAAERARVLAAKAAANEVAKAERAKARQEARAAKIEAETKAKAEKLAARQEARERKTAERESLRLERIANGTSRRRSTVNACRSGTTSRVPAAEREGVACQRPGCNHAAGLSHVGPFCPRCISVARSALHRQGVDTAPADALTAWMMANQTREQKPLKFWDTVEDLGLVPDAEIAKRYGVSKAAVGMARRARSIFVISPGEQTIRTGSRRGFPFDWSAVDWSVGNDLVVAVTYGLSPHTVTAARIRLGIPPARERGIGRKPVDWDAEPMLGHVSDSVLARKYGVSKSAVVDARRQRKIPAHKVTPDSFDWSSVDWYMADRRIAMSTGFCRETVAARRKMMDEANRAGIDAEREIVAVVNEMRDAGLSIRAIAAEMAARGLTAK